MQLRSHGQSITVRQASELTPRPLFFQQTQHEIEGVSRCEQRQQKQTVELRRTPMGTPTAASVRGHQLIDELIRYESGKLFQQGSRSGGCKLASHTSQLPLLTLPVSPNPKAPFFISISLQRCSLLRISEHPLKGQTKAPAWRLALPEGDEYLGMTLPGVALGYYG